MAGVEPDVVQDVKNALTAVIAAAGVLHEARSALSEERRTELLATIARQAWRATSLLDGTPVPAHEWWTDIPAGGLRREER